MKLSVLLMISLFSFSAFAFMEQDVYRAELKAMTKKGHNQHHGYREARQMIMQNIHLRSDRTGYFVKDVYCRLQHRSNVGPAKMPNHQIINIEHTWPQSRFGKNKDSSITGMKKADLHHLYPTNSRANSTRGNLKFSEFRNQTGLDGCQSSKRGTITETGEAGFEPPIEHKGNVARALFYFAVRYDMRIAAHEEFFLRQWNVIDPVDADELARNNEIEKLQGNRNPFIDDSALVELIENF